MRDAAMRKKKKMIIKAIQMDALLYSIYLLRILRRYSLPPFVSSIRY